MDKRKTVGSNKYNTAHKEMIVKANQILATSNFLDLTFQKLSKNSNYSKTTIYFHFDSNIFFLYQDVLNSFRNEIYSIVSKLNNENPRNFILETYKKIFEYIDLNPNLYKNLFLIALIISGTNYKTNDLVTPLLKAATLKINKKLDFQEHWSLFTAHSIQYATSNDLNEKKRIKDAFYRSLDSIIK